MSESYKTEALAWHSRVHELEIEITRLKEENRLLILENVKLRNKGLHWKEQKHEPVSNNC